MGYIAGYMSQMSSLYTYICYTDSVVHICRTDSVVILGMLRRFDTTPVVHIHKITFVDSYVILSSLYA